MITWENRIRQSLHRSRWGQMLIQARQFLRKPAITIRAHREQRADLQAFLAHDALALNAVPLPQRTGPVVLFVSLSSVVHRLKLESLMALALRLRGCRCVILTSRGQGFPSYHLAYLQALHFWEIIYLEDHYHFTRAEQEEFDREQARFFRELRQETNLGGYTYRGYRLGPHMLASLSRTLHAGVIDLNSAEVRALAEKQFRLFLERTVVAEKVFAQVRPGITFFQDLFYVNYGPFFEVALKTSQQVVQHTLAYSEDNAMILRRCSEAARSRHPNSLAPTTWTKAQAAPWTVGHLAEVKKIFESIYHGKSFVANRNQHNKRLKSREELLLQLGLDRSKKTAVLFSHILWDANSLYGENLFNDFGDWLIASVRAAIGNPHLNWIIKLHPDNVWKSVVDGFVGEVDEAGLIHAKLGEMPPHVKILRADTDINTYSLYELADFGITIRGSIGMQLPCLGKPVLTAGTGRYSGLGFTLDSASKEEYLKRLAQLQDLPPLSDNQKERAMRYAYYIYRLRPWIHSTMVARYRPVAEAGHPLAWNLELIQRDPVGIASAPDMAAFADWVLDSADEDFLQQDAIAR